MAKLIPTLPSPYGQSPFARRSSPSVAQQATTDLHTKTVALKRAVSASPYASPQQRARLVERIVADALGARPLPLHVRQAFTRCASALVSAEVDLFTLPPPPAPGDAVGAYQARALIDQRLAFFSREAELVAQWQRRLTSTLATIAAALPRVSTERATITIPLSLLSLLPNPAHLISGLIADLLPLAPTPGTPGARPGARLAEALVANLLAVSKVGFEDAQLRPDRLRWPDAAKLSAPELVDTYLAGTPLASLLQTTIAIPVPTRVRFEHAITLAPPGHGKTQFLQSLMLNDIDDPQRPAVVLVDSQTDAIDTLSRLARFDPTRDRRLIILDPSDVTAPLALNLFHVDRTQLAALTPRQREEYLAGVLELFNYLLSGLLGSELTPKMSVVFRFLSQLMITIEGATIHTLIALLTDPTPFLPSVTNLPATAQTFITDHLFADRQYNETRKQILRRLFHVLSNPAFERMFGHAENKFSMGDALNQGRVVLINTNKQHLKSDASALFGRFMIATLMQATLARAIIPEAQRRPAFIYLDEAHEYLDQNINTLFVQARKYKVGLHLFSQTLAQADTAGLRSLFLSIPALRFIGKVSHAEARVLAPEINTTAELITSVGKTERSSQWAAYARNVTPATGILTVPFFSAERAPKMSPAAYARLLARIRAEVSAPPVVRQSPTPPPAATPRVTRVQSNEGDPY